jgi:hypothetical protein
MSNYLTNIPINARTMNGIINLSDGINEFSGGNIQFGSNSGAISFYDGTTLDSTKSFAKLSSDNIFTGLNSFTGDTLSVSKNLIGNTISTIGLASLNSLLVDNTTEINGICSLKNTTISNLYTNGSLIVSGGIGVKGNINCGESINAVNTITCGNLISNGILSSTGITSIYNTGISSSITSGALVVSGGVGIGQDLYIGGIIRCTNQIYSSAISTGGVIYTGGICTIANTTDSNSISNGALIVSGGVGISGNVNIGGIINTINTINSNGIFNITNTTISNLYTNGSLVVSGGVGVKGNINCGERVNVTNTITCGNLISNGILSSTGITSIYNTGISSSITSGALVVSGGVGIGQDLYIGGIIRCTNQIYSSAISTGGTIYTGGICSIANTTDSSSTSNGALIVSGGTGISGNVNIGGLLTTTSNIVANNDIQLLGGKKLYVNSPGVNHYIMFNSTRTGCGIYGYRGGSFQTTINSSESMYYTTTEVHVPLLTDSTSSTNGAFVCDGGMGIGGNVNIVGNTVISGFLTSGAIFPTSITATGSIRAAIFNSSGSLNVSGTSALSNTNITGNVNVSGNINLLTASTSNTLNIYGNTYLTDKGLYLRTNDGNHFIKFSGTYNGPEISGYLGGALTITTNTLVTSTASLIWTIDAVKIIPSTDSTSISSGSLRVAGGTGISKNLWVGGSTNVQSLNINDTVYVNDNALFLRSSQTEYIKHSDGYNGIEVAGYVNGVLSINTDYSVPSTPSLLWSTTQVQIYPTTNATSSTNGSLYVKGGISCVKDIYVSGNIRTNDLTIAGNLVSNGNISYKNNILDTHITAQTIRQYTLTVGSGGRTLVSGQIPNNVLITANGGTIYIPTLSTSLYNGISITFVSSITGPNYTLSFNTGVTFNRQGSINTGVYVSGSTSITIMMYDNVWYFTNQF